jgi:hypothetical protein
VSTQLQSTTDLENKSKGSLSFENESQRRPPGPFAEFVDFLIHNKRWWLTPIIVILLLLSLLIGLTNTVIAPFIYALF